MAEEPWSPNVWSAGCRPAISHCKAHVEAEQDTHSMIAVRKLVSADLNHISRMYSIGAKTGIYWFVPLV